MTGARARRRAGRWSRAGGLLAACAAYVRASASWLQAAGAAVVAVAGFWALATGDDGRRVVHERVRPALRRRRADGVLPRHARARRGAGARVLVALPASRPGAAARSRALTAAFVLVARGVALRARPADVPRRLGADDAAAGGGDPRRARRTSRSSRRTVFTYVAITHLGGAGTWIAILLLAQAGAIGDPSALLDRLGAADRDRARGARRDGDEGRRDAAARLAAARASDRAGAGVGADERRDDQGRDLRRSCACSSTGSASLPVWVGVLVLALGALSAVGGVIYALFQHDLKRLLALHSIENVGIIVLGLGACLRAARARRRRRGRRSRSRPRCCTRSTTRSSRRCSSSARARSSGRSASLELDRLGGLLRRMPWTAARSSSARWRSPGCRR